MRGLLLSCIAGCSLWAVANGEPACVQQKDIATHGVKLDDNESHVRKLLGPPQKVLKGTYYDDGGAYPTRSLVYSVMTVTLGRDRVEDIEIRGWHHPIAAGLFIGGSPEELRTKSAIDNSTKIHGAAFTIRYCGAEDLYNSGLSIFVVRKRVTKAVLFSYGP